MLKMTRLFALAAALTLASTSAQAAAILAIQANTTNLTSAGGVVNLTITMTTGPEGIGAIGYDVVGSSVLSYDSFNGLNVAVAPLAELSPVDTNGADALGFNLGAITGGFAGGPVTIGTVSFNIGPNITAGAQAVNFGIGGYLLVYDSAGNQTGLNVSGVTITVAGVPVPEPGTLLLLGSGLAGLLIIGRRR